MNLVSRPFARSAASRIDAHVADLDEAAELLRARRDENTCRKPFTPTEEHVIYEALLTLESRRLGTGGPKARGGGEVVVHPLPSQRRSS